MATKYIAILYLYAEWELAMFLLLDFTWDSTKQKFFLQKVTNIWWIKKDLVSL